VDMDIPDGFGVPLVDLTTHLLPEPTMDALGELFTPPPAAPSIIPGLYDDREQTHSAHEVRFSLTTSSGNLMVTYARARFTGLRSRVVMYVSASGSAVTFSSIGVYTVDQATLNLTELVSRVDDPTIPGALGRVERTLDTPFSFVEGEWYAAAHLSLGSPPGARAGMSLPSFAIAPHFDPPTHGILGSQTDLPATATKASLVNTANATQGAVYYEFLD
jgi:hypothetical protein